MALKKVYAAETEFMAQAVSDILLDEGIPSLTRRNEVAGLPLNLGKSEWCWGELHVDDEHYERALELIAAFEGSLGELAEVEPVVEKEPPT